MPAKDCGINAVLNALCGTRSGAIIFRDCFKPTALRADTKAIEDWIGRLPDDFEYAVVLREYLTWAATHNPDNEPYEVTPDE